MDSAEPVYSYSPTVSGDRARMLRWRLAYLQAKRDPQALKCVGAQLADLPAAAFRSALSLLPIQMRRIAQRARWRAEGAEPLAPSYDRDVIEIEAAMIGKRLPPRVGVHKCKACQAHGGVNNPFRPYPNPAHIAFTYGPGAYEMLCGGLWLD